MQGVVVCVRVSVGVKFVAEQGCRLRGRVQVQVVVVVSHVDPGRQRVVVSGRILAVLLGTHGAVTWTQDTHTHGWGYLSSRLVPTKLSTRFERKVKKMVKQTNTLTRSLRARARARKRLNYIICSRMLDRLSDFMADWSC